MARWYAFYRTAALCVILAALYYNSVLFHTTNTRTLDLQARYVSSPMVPLKPTTVTANNNNATTTTTNNNNNNNETHIQQIGLGKHVVRVGETSIPFVSDNINNKKSSENEVDQDNDDNDANHLSKQLEARVISAHFNDQRLKHFYLRNPNINASWFPAVNGRDPLVLQRWFQYTDTVINASASRHEFESPHVVGCYLSHYDLLSTLAYRHVDLRPRAFLVLEDDASCVPDLQQQILSTLPHLPNDWDLLYVGGKPFVDFPNLPNNTTLYHDSTNQTLRRDLCRGAFGMARGPRAPNGSRSLSYQQQRYWRTYYTTNTEAYVVNPHRIHHVLSMVEPPPYHEAVDLVLANRMAQGKLAAYMTTRRLCDQQPHQRFVRPRPWNGYYSFQLPSNNNNSMDASQYHPGLTSNYMWQEDIVLENCTY